ncbi:MAG: 50S ribosomal protein L21 [Solirubrobacterales bacterium]|nr:50S ribosomal protein L21 [Solirubrobacterales bacterium]MCO5327166.1 50S ribosomal protein L21 [Solirubrobacterales bacterium]
MPTYAIVESGGKQYRVEKGQSLLVDRLSEDEGAKVPLRAVMFRDDDNTVLSPGDLEKVKVEAKVAGHERGPKIRVFKYKAKKGYRKRKGHRSELTRLEITDVAMLSRKPAAKKSAADKPAEEKPAAEKPKAESGAQASGAKGLPDDLGKPATGALEEAGLTDLEKVAGKTEAELLDLKGVGPKAVETLEKALADAGLSFKQTDQSEESD